MTAARDELLHLRELLHERGPAPCQVADDPERWFAGGVDTEPALAAELCASCPAAAACLAYAIAADERAGVWGGLTTPDRRRVAAS